MGINRREPTQDHLDFMRDLKATIAVHQHLSAEDMLAVVSQLVGSLVALQDQTKSSPSMVMEAVAQNIEVGNRMAIDVLTNTKGNG